MSLPACPLITSESLAPSAPAMRHLGRETVDDHRGAAAGDGDGVVALRAVDGHGVGRSVALAAARLRRQVEVDLLDVGAGEVADHDVVGAAQGVELDVLDVVEVHGDVGDVAEEQRPAAVGRDVDVLGDVGAVEQQRVGAGLALDDVAAVARVPDERVVARAEQSHVVAAAAGHGVVAVAAQDRVLALAADDGVVAGAGIDGEADDAGRQGGRIDRVVAVAGIDDQRGRRPRCPLTLTCAASPATVTAGAGADDVDLVAAVGAVDDHLVGRAVAAPRPLQPG